MSGDVPNDSWFGKSRTEKVVSGLEGGQLINDSRTKIEKKKTSTVDIRDPELVRRPQMVPILLGLNG